MLFTSIALGAGFLVYVIGDMGNIREFGILNALTIGLAFFADTLRHQAFPSAIDGTELPGDKRGER